MQESSGVQMAANHLSRKRLVWLVPLALIRERPQCFASWLPLQWRQLSGAQLVQWNDVIFLFSASSDGNGPARNPQTALDASKKETQRPADHLPGNFGHRRLRRIQVTSLSLTHLLEMMSLINQRITCCSPQGSHLHNSRFVAFE